MPLPGKHHEHDDRTGIDPAVAKATELANRRLAQAQKEAKSQPVRGSNERNR